MISSQLLDLGQALTVQSYGARSVRTQQANVGVSSPATQINLKSSIDTGGRALGSLEKLHTQKKTAESAHVAIEEIKDTIQDTERLLVSLQAGSSTHQRSTIESSKSAMLKVQSELESLKSQVESDANEKAIFTALETVVNDAVTFYEALDEDTSFSSSMDSIRNLKLKSLSSQAQIEKVQNQLEASTYQVVQLSSSYEANLFNPSNPFDLAESLYDVSFKLNGLGTNTTQLGSVLDQVT